VFPCLTKMVRGFFNRASIVRRNHVYRHVYQQRSLCFKCRPSLAASPMKKPHILFILPKIGLSKPTLLHRRYASGRLEEFLERVGFSLVKELSPSEPIQTAKDRTTGYSSPVELLPWS
jgi:hypothetical protein